MCPILQKPRIIHVMMGQNQCFTFLEKTDSRNEQLLNDQHLKFRKLEEILRTNSQSHEVLVKVLKQLT